MKHLKHFFVVLLLLCSAAANASDIFVDGIYYNILSSEEGTVEVTGVSYREYSGNIVIPESFKVNNKVLKVVGIGYRAFSGCYELISVKIPNSVTYIGDEAFLDCSGLASVDFGSNVSSIGGLAFCGCSSLKSVEIPGKVTSIDEYTFHNCSALASVSIPGSVTDISGSAFSGCISLKYVTLEDGTEPLYTGYDSSYGLFSNCPLDSVYIGREHSYSGYYSPFYNSSLRAVTMGENVTKIGESEFYGCKNLSSVTISESVDSIGTYAFYGCKNVSELICHAKTPPVCGEEALDGINKKNCILWVPELHIAKYQSANQWKDFYSIKGIPAEMYTVTYIVDGEVYATDSIAYGSEIVLRDEPTKEGHTFSGWSEAPETMPAEDIVIEGSFSVNSYTITYKVDGEVYETVTAEYGTAIEPIEEPIKEGHTFSGWSDVPETMPANDITIEGTFSINSYAVTFMIDGEVYETATVEFGAEIELPTPPEKEGYIFSGWVGVPDTMPAEDIVIEGEYIVDTTGINDVKAENGKVKGVYDLQGRKVDNPINGIYIVNGKKVFVK